MERNDRMGNVDRTSREPLLVYREIFGHYQLVGRLESKGGWSDTHFTYESGYLDSARFDDGFGNPTSFAISHTLPLQREPFDSEVTRSFFLNLLPEGDIRDVLNARIHSSQRGFQKLLEYLDHETSGALVFGRIGEDLEDGQGYDPVPDALLFDFASNSVRVAADLDLERRISMAGSQHKIGLYRDPMATGDVAADWYLARGTAPTTHLVKATSHFEDMTVNEAFCLGVARSCEFEVPSAFLIPIEGHEPLLAVERFDRLMPIIRGRLVGGERIGDLMDFTLEEIGEYTVGEIGQRPMVFDGMPRPYRRHQEDLFQSLGFRFTSMYEPTDGHYASAIARDIDRYSENPFGDRVYFFSQLLFDLLIGNCDNHLKNYSFVWDGGWGGCRLSPMYDLLSTTYYPNTSREMGVSLCRSRRIDSVTWDDLEAVGRVIGVSKKMARVLFDELAEQILVAIPHIEEAIAEEGFLSVQRVARFVKDGALQRIARVRATR